MINRSLVILNRIVFVIFSIISLVFYTFGQSYVPRLFKLDSGTIRLSMLGGIDGSYGATAHFYSMLGFRYNSPELSVELFSWIIYIISLIFIFYICNGNILNKSKFLLTLIYTITFGFYYATFSKDVILLLFIVVISYIFIKKGTYYHIPIILLVYGYYFRSYWMIVAIMMSIFIFLKLKKIRVHLVVILTMLIIYAYEIITGLYITDTRVDVNAGRIANTMISNLIPNTSFFSDILNYLYVLISMVVPLQGVGSVNGIFYYLWIWLLIFLFLKNRKILNVNMSYLIIIYFNIQACFEPDFGSATRHMMPLILIIFISLYRKNNEKV